MQSFDLLGIPGIQAPPPRIYQHRTTPSTDLLGMIDDDTSNSVDTPAIHNPVNDVQSVPAPLKDPESVRTMLGNASGNAGNEELQPIRLNFIVSHTPEIAGKMIEGICKKMTEESSGGQFEYQQTAGCSYMKIVAPRKDMTAHLNDARYIVQDMTSDKSTQRRVIFQEPPAIVNKDFHIVLEKNPMNNNVRPKLELGNNTAATPNFPEDIDSYAKRLSEHVYKSLKTASRIPASLAPRAHLGHYVLRTYRNKDSYEYNDFHAMINHPRSSGWLETRIGHGTLAQRVLNFVRNDTSGLFNPIGIQFTSAAEVSPEYTFETHSQRATFSTPLESKGSMTECRPYRIVTSGANSSLAEFDIMNLSVGKKLDWKLEVVDEENSEKTYPEVVKCLRSLQFALHSSGDKHHLDTYPRPQGSTDPTCRSVAAKLKDAAVKTVYNFRWKSTSYVVQIAISHRWDDVDVMSRGRTRPVVDFGISVFGEYWDMEEDAGGNNWGSELQFLFDEGHGDGATSGTDRVAGFLQVVGDIRDAVDSSF